MPVHGRQTSILIDEFDLSTYFRNANLDAEAEIIDTTTFQAAARTFIPGFVDGKLSFDGLFESKSDAVAAADRNAVDDALAPALGDQTAELIVTVGYDGTDAAGDAVTMCAARETKYSVASPFNGVVSAMAEMQSSGGLRRGVVLLPKAARTATATGTGQDGTGGAGTAQVETATVAGTITGDGDVSVVVTAAGMTGSPKTIPVAVVNGDSAATVAGKIRAALGADADVTAMFAVSGAGVSVVLTRLIAAANDATLNVALSTGTATGLTAAPTSANTTAGVAPTSSTNGFVAHLHVTAFGSAGDTLDVTVQHSDFLASGYTTIGTFAQVSGVGAERITGAGTVKRYVRAVGTIAGNGSESFTFCVTFARL